MCVLSVVFLVWPRAIVQVFSTVPEVIDVGVLSLQVFASGYIFYAFGMVMIQAFNGAGDTKTPTYINFFSFWLFQLPLAYFTVISMQWGPFGVLLTIVFSEILLTLLSVYFFRQGKWKQTAV